MKIADKQRFVDQLTRLAAVFRARLTTEGIDGYWDALEDLQTEAVLRAMSALQREEDRMPTPRRIRDEVGSTGVQGGPREEARTTRRIRRDPWCFCGRDKVIGTLFCRECWALLPELTKRRLENRPVPPSAVEAEFTWLKDYHGIRPRWSPERVYGERHEEWDERVER